jgi:hypothetical protein
MNEKSSYVYLNILSDQLQYLVLLKGQVQRDCFIFGLWHKTTSPGPNTYLKASSNFVKYLRSYWNMNFIKVDSRLHGKSFTSYPYVSNFESVWFVFLPGFSPKAVRSL